MAASQASETDQSGASGPLGLMTALARSRKLIVGVPFVVALVAAAISIALPNIYRAETKLLPPQQAQSSAAALLSQLGGMAGAAAGVAGLKSPNELYVGMLRSRTIADKLIARFGLAKEYGEESPQLIRAALEANTAIVTGKDGMISIQVEGENKKLVAPLANAYVEELLSLTKVLAVTESSQRRLFFERQLELAKNNLAKSEVALKSVLDTRGVVSVDMQSQAVVETVARLRAQASAKEIQLNAMRPFVTESHPDYRRAAEELASLRRELSSLENGRPGAEGGEIQGKGVENIQLLRDVKYYQMLYELLAKQYEVARLDEAKDPAIIQVLDAAIEPERKIKPKRALFVVTLTILALAATMLAVLFLDLKQRALQDPGAARQWEEFKRQFRGK
ncbi:Wzz/FepE/Etk N-terminal domain-containing protein [Massilia sp. AB1]|uniref:Wzz/FepE/Etk N-terminal domain-containing protein n=1 Tax=Massilia sp. AB1 TaxID=2823371 RepID=UPI001B83D0BA|nr:Wzz/FepE/Etk N-terminal domain-containing protein [Massilia sp. AB1]MBQ5939645.1 lipopolysaccharide biosynthesis protein [Massilia sp. AB1]